MGFKGKKVEEFVLSESSLDVRELQKMIEEKGIHAEDASDIFRLIQRITAEFTPFEEPYWMAGLEIIWEVCKAHLWRMEVDEASKK